MEAAGKEVEAQQSGPFVAVVGKGGVPPVLSAAGTVANALTKPLEKEAIRLKTSSRKLAGCLLFLTVGLALFWAAASSIERRSIAAGQQLTTLRQANRFTIDSLGRASERLASKTDSTLYEFLADHHDTEVLQADNKNVVKEVLTAIEHESAQAGVVLIVQLFSDIYAAWPKTSISDKGKKRLKRMIADLEKLQKVMVEEQLAASAAANEETKATDEGGAPSERDQETKTKTSPQSKVEAGLKAIQEELQEMRDFGQVEDPDEKMFEDVIKMQSPSALASVLRTAVYVDECRPYLAKIDKVRMEDMKGKPMERLDLEGKKNKKNADKRTPVPTAPYLPSEQNLIHATKAIEELEAFLNDKPELSAVIRNMLLADLNNR